MLLKANVLTISQKQMTFLSTFMVVIFNLLLDIEDHMLHKYT